MALIEDTKILTQQLFRSGSANNEQLQTLLWQLKEITELSDKELDIPEGEFQTFFMSYLTELANSYRPTNTSELPERLLSIDSSLNDMRVRIQKATEEFNQKVGYIVDDRQSFELISVCVNDVRHSTLEASTMVSDKINDWLDEIRY